MSAAEITGAGRRVQHESAVVSVRGRDRLDQGRARRSLGPGVVVVGCKTDAISLWRRPVRNRERTKPMQTKFATASPVKEATAIRPVPATSEAITGICSAICRRSMGAHD